MDTSSKSFALPISGEPGRAVLRPANSADLENLRTWKNRHRTSFFHQEEISPAQQQQWFEAYAARADDFLFIVEADGKPVGCMGIRLIDDCWDVYNVILGLDELRGSRLMSSALGAMLGFAASRRRAPVLLKVLKGNNAIEWYRKNGFVITAERADHFSMTYRPQPCRDHP